MKKILTAILIFAACFLAACSSAQENKGAAETAAQTAAQASSDAKETAPADAEEKSEAQPTSAPESTQAPQESEQPGDEGDHTPEKEMMLQVTIGDTPVSVAWEDNDAVAALKEMCLDQTLTINMSMYGGFEQVGSIGAYLPQDDVQTITTAGDIVLYSGNQIVVFYGSNTWSYTRLGHIADQSEDGMTQLLANGDTTLTIGLK